MAYKDILPQAVAQFLGLASNANYTPNYTWEQIKYSLSKHSLSSRKHLGAWFYIAVSNDRGGNEIDGRAFNKSGTFTNTATVTIETIVKTNTLNIQTQDLGYEEQIVEGLIQEDVITAFSKAYDELCVADVQLIDYDGESDVVDESPHSGRVVRKNFTFTVVYEQNRFIK